jgi:tubulin-folding cofactor B
MRSVTVTRPPSSNFSRRFLRFYPPDTVLAYKQRQKLGRFAEKADEEQQETEEDVNIQVGSRCQIESTEPGFHKHGTVRFVGKPKFSHGVWVGVEYDEPIGKNDGSSVS